MIKASLQNKAHIISILTNSFQDNKSINYIVKQDAKRLQRINALMDYSFDVCYQFGEVFLNEEQNACALVLYPHLKRTTLRTIWLDIKLMIKVIGIANINKVLKRSASIDKIKPTQPMYYLWFIGVLQTEQHKGVGSQLIQKIIEESNLKNLPIYLETSTLKNLPWYKKLGFDVYDKLDISYDLFFLRKELSPLVNTSGE